MKKCLLVAFALLFTGFYGVHAQTERGSVMAGGNMRLHIPTNDGDNVQQSYFSLNPTLGFFIANNLAIGAGIPIKSDRYTNDGNRTTRRSSSIGFAPFLRYYIGESDIKPFLGARFGIEHFKTVETNQADRTDDAVFVGFGAGIAFFLNEHVALEPSISYDAYSRGNTNSSFNFNVGFQVYFPWFLGTFCLQEKGP